MSIKELEPLGIKEYMTGITVRDYNYTATSMDVYIPTLMVDKENDGGSNTISIPPNIFSSKENITVSSTITDLNYINIKVSALFTATFKALNYDSRPGPHFPKGTKVRIYAPDLNIENALIVPLM